MTVAQITAALKRGGHRATRPDDLRLQRGRDNLRVRVVAAALISREACNSNNNWAPWFRDRLQKLAKRLESGKSLGPLMAKRGGP